MESAFLFYLKLGLDHIADIHAYDHIVFIIALCAIYSLSQWRQVAVLVTAFTIGHSITLALAALNVIQVPGALIEFLIPVTIFITSIYNIVRKPSSQLNSRITLNYFMALFFGLIHGMGFSSYFRSLMGQEESVVKPLFAFNLGIETGQLMIVGVILLLSFVFLQWLRVDKKDWTLVISGATAGIAFILMLETFEALIGN
ncbi:MAG: HupE/UreJ family protein [Saprospiraceae bacterium]|nr:HupE/UreJ family protein [Saprospiraceae bacterium]